MDAPVTFEGHVMNLIQDKLEETLRAPSPLLLISGDAVGVYTDIPMSMRTMQFLTVSDWFAGSWESRLTRAIEQRSIRNRLRRARRAPRYWVRGLRWSVARRVAGDQWPEDYD